MTINNTKNKYIKDLERKLKKMPQDERLDAIGFYKEYLVDTGVDTYKDAVEKLGTPNKVAAQIMSDHYMKDIQISHGEIVQKSRKPIWKILAAVFLGIIAVPVGIPLILSVLLVGVLMVLVIGLLIMSILMVSALLILSGLIFIGMTIPTFAVHTLTALFILGAGLIFIGLGVLCLQLTIVCMKACYRGLVHIAKKLQRRRGNQYA